jgi:TPR repeat protein
VISGCYNESLAEAVEALRMTDHLTENKSWITKSWTSRIVITLGVIVLLWIIIARVVDTQAIVAGVTESSHRIISQSTDPMKMPAVTSDVESLYQDAVAHLVGDGVSKDSDKALEFYRQAADMGHPQAQEDLGLIYYTGYGVEQNFVEAVKWYKKAALQGRTKSAYDLGIMHCRGEGTPVDDSEGAKWILVAAEAGSAEAQWTLALMYGRGQGVPQDRQAAMEWIHRAAERGYETAEKSLQSNNEELLNIIFQYPEQPALGETTAKAD